MDPTIVDDIDIDKCNNGRVKVVYLQYLEVGHRPKQNQHKTNKTEFVTQKWALCTPYSKMATIWLFLYIHIN